MNKEKMFEEIEAYFQHINYAYNTGVAYFALRDNTVIENIANKAPGFFTMAQYALSKTLFIELAKMFCGSGEERTFRKLINMVEGNCHLFTSPKTIKKLCEEARDLLDNTYSQTIARIKSRRDKDLTHNDPEYFSGKRNPAVENDIPPKEAENLCKLVAEFCNILLQYLDSSKTVVLTGGANDIRDLLKEMKDS